MPPLEIVPFSDDHLDVAATLLAERHAAHRAAEPLLPAIDDFRAALEREWHVDGASGSFASWDGEPAGYLVGRPVAFRDMTWLTVGIAGQAIRGDAEIIRDLYATVAESWMRAGHAQHAVFVPSYDAALVDAWFWLTFGASAALAMRETASEPDVDAAISIRRGTNGDIEDAARLERAMTEAMVPAPSFSSLAAETQDEIVEEWTGTWSDETYVHFVAEQDGRIVGHLLLYRRPPDLRVPKNSIDLAQASTEPELRGSGIGRALTAHAISWAHEHGIPVMTTDWRMPNLWRSRFWPKRGFRTTFLRLYRSIP